MDATFKAEIKDAIWELNDKKQPLTVKNIYDQAAGKISFDKLPEIMNFLEELKENWRVYNHTYCNGYLQLMKVEKIEVKDLISRA